MTAKTEHKIAYWEKQKIDIFYALNHLAQIEYQYFLDKSDIFMNVMSKHINF